MTTIQQSCHLDVFIQRDINDVYAFASVPENFPLWASGLGKSLRKANDGWVAETDVGPANVRFSKLNGFGVLDHWVSPKLGLPFYIPMRVISVGSGCLLIFTLLRLSGVSDEKFASDTEWVMRDLISLKTLLEAT